MNNPFHRGAMRAFRESVMTEFGMPEEFIEESDSFKKMEADFERRLEAQARAFDLCKRGTEISMATLSHEMLKAFYLAKARVKIDGDWNAAERVFREHMKPHFEIRLW